VNYTALYIAEAKSFPSVYFASITVQPLLGS